MSPRPRKVSDDQVFEALHRLMLRVKPDAITLAAVGEEAGLTAGALVQRFGSKVELLRAFNARFAEGSGDLFGQLRARGGTPLGALEAYADFVASMAVSRETLAHHLAYLQQDLSDPETFAHLRVHTRAARRALETWLREAVAEGALRPGTDPAALARLVQAVLTGSMMQRVFFREGSAPAFVRRDLALALGPHRLERA